jgi:hypothetical protein
MTAERARLGRGLTVPEEANASFLHDYFTKYSDNDNDL